ncbi:MAG: hypothetical protein NZ651_00115 [Candidatus Bipolaricaulota bacterium]|nr:hypothetical protein [Candidatus Bipolaricaulota bacterium]MDW8126175.1 hypothetical protein [Candidatus Bipolaricaulota bacterium]
MFLLVSFLALVVFLPYRAFCQPYFQSRFAGVVLPNEPDAPTPWLAAGSALRTADGTCATTTENNAYLYLGGFGFQIPAMATILGIKVSLKAGHSAAGAFGLFLLKNGNRVGSHKTVSPGVATTCTETGWKSWGSATDLWGTSWTAADINAQGFGLRVGSGTTAGTRFVDAAEITVYYALPNITAPSDWSPRVARGAVAESEDLIVTYSYVPPGGSIIVGVQNVYPAVPPGLRLWVKGPAQLGYVELPLSEPYNAVTIVTNLSGSGSFTLQLKVEAREVPRSYVGASLTVILVYTLLIS